MIRHKYPFHHKLLGALALGLLTSTASAELGCPQGFIPDGDEKFPDSAFTNGYDSFTSDIVFKAPVGSYPVDGNGSAFGESGIGILSGDYLPTDDVVAQHAFPGDPAPAGGAAPAPAVNTWFVYNGNNDDSPRKIWQTTLDGLTPNTDYAFTAYFSNAIKPGLQAQGFVAPLVSFRANGKTIQPPIPVCDGGGGLDPVDHDCLNEATEDRWQRLGITISTGAETSLTLSIHDAQIPTAAGNDFALTLISFQKCRPIAPTALDHDNDGVSDDIDLDDDNDGILDTNEGAGDSDGDGVPNRLDLDSDNDGLPDIVEALGTDADNDGKIDNFTDANGDGYEDALDANPLPLPDTDGDGARDVLDLNSDADVDENGVPLNDVAEAELGEGDADGRITPFTDANGDGWDDNARAAIGAANGALPDGDNDGVPEYRDPLPAPGVQGSEGPGEVQTRLDGGTGALGPAGLLMLLGAWRRKRKTVIAPATPLLLALLSLTAHGAEKQFYAGGGLGLSMLEPRIVNLPTLSLTDDTDLGAKLFVGYDLRYWLSVEAFAATLGSAGFNNGAEIDYDMYGVNLLANFPNNSPGLSWFPKIGIGTINNSASGDINFRGLNDPQVQLGVGVEYQFENHYSVRAEYEYFDRDARFLSLSLMKRWGQPPAPVKPPQPEPKPAYPDAASALPPPPVPPAPAKPYAAPPPPITFEPVYFDSDQATLRRSEIDKLEGVVATLKAHPDLTLRLIGNTDSIASDSYNNRLSMNRIKAVATYLIDHGIAPERLRYKALGEQSPAADNSSEAGRALNRRVELIPE